MTTARAFRGFHFPAEVVRWAVRRYLRFPISYRRPGAQPWGSTGPATRIGDLSVAVACRWPWPERGPDPNRAGGSPPLPLPIRS